MTKEEAFKLSRENGTKIKHRYFSDNEFIIVQGAVITLTEGYVCSIQEFNKYRTDDSWSTDWELF